jgi:hypothetical protein
MKPTARILKFMGNEMRSAADIAAAEEALMVDVISGDITPSESRKIQKELNQSIARVDSALKVSSQIEELNKYGNLIERSADAAK